MALQLFQELIPFSNEKTRYPASNGTLNNPIVMPLSFDVTSVYNTVETVFYIRNDDKDKYYNNILVTLMAPKSEFADKDNVATVSFNINSIKVIYSPSASGGIVTKLYGSGNSDKFTLDTEYISEIIPQSFIDAPIVINNSTWHDSLTNAMLPISGKNGFTLDQVAANIVDARFSYGYDEVSELGWNNKSHSIVIPSIGNSTTPDNSFIPIRLRIWVNGQGSLYTLRDYSINISYSSEGTIA